MNADARTGMRCSRQFLIISGCCTLALEAAGSTLYPAQAAHFASNQVFWRLSNGADIPYLPTLSEAHLVCGGSAAPSCLDFYGACRRNPGTFYRTYGNCLRGFNGVAISPINRIN